MSNFYRTHPRASVRALTAVSFVSLVSVTAGALAETTIEPVVVTAARIEQKQTDALPHTTVISSETIRNSQAIDVLTLLRNEAGVQITQSGGPGQLASFFLRGAAPSQTLILIDGVPARREGFSGSPALEHILPEQIDHIEIVRGNVSAIYGSGAIGGVIQIFTRKGDRTPIVGASVEAGSRGTIKVTGDISGQSDGTRYAVSAARFRTDGFSTMNRVQFPQENPDKNGYDNTSVSVSLSQQWAKGHEAGIRLYANEGNVTYDGGGFGAPTDINKGSSKQQSLTLFSRDKISSSWVSNLTLSQTRFSNRDISISAFSYDLLYESTANLLQWNNVFDLTPNWTMTAGADVGHDKANGSSDYGAGITVITPSRSTSSVYAGVSGKIEAHQLQANVRHDQVDSSGSKTTGYLGYGYVLTPALKLVASASTAFNAPTLTQLYDPISGNANLKPEISRSVEVGAQYALAGSLVRATVFKTRTKDQFGFSPDPQICTFLVCPTLNIDQASNRGFELSASGQLAGVDLKTSLTLQEPVNDATHQILVRRARTLASVSAAQAFGALRLGADVQYSGNRNERTNSLGGYVLANLNARYALSKSVSLFARVDNLLNRDYQTAYGYNQPPRGVFAGLRWQQ
jgi:vitamin B12 transporter